MHPSFTAASLLFATTAWLGAAECEVRRPSIPAISGLIPVAGSSFGGETVFLVGSGLSGVVDVKFGGVSCPNWFVSNDALLTCVTPPAVAGAASVEVTWGGGSVVSPVDFHYEPALTGATPAVAAPSTTPLSFGIDVVGLGPGLRLFVNGSEVAYALDAVPGRIVASVPGAATTFAGALVFEAAASGESIRVSAPLTVPLHPNQNRGHILARPLGADATNVVATALEGLPPFVPFTAVVDPFPVFATAFPNPSLGFVLEVGSPFLLVLRDGLHLFSTADNVATNGDGEALILISTPSPALAGFAGKLQAAYFDPSTPAFYGLTYAYPFRL